MRVECRFYGPFREDVGEKRIDHETDVNESEALVRTSESPSDSDDVDESRSDSFANQNAERSGDAETVGELLSELATRYPELEGKLVEDGEIAGSTVVTRNKKDVRHLDGTATELSEGDVIRLTPSVYGG